MESHLASPLFRKDRYNTDIQNGDRNDFIGLATPIFILLVTLM